MRTFLLYCFYVLLENDSLWLLTGKSTYLTVERAFVTPRPPQQTLFCHFSGVPEHYCYNIRDWSHPLVKSCGTCTNEMQADAEAQEQPSSAARSDCKSCSLHKLHMPAHQSQTNPENTSAIPTVHTVPFGKERVFLTSQRRNQQLNVTFDHPPTGKPPASVHLYDGSYRLSKSTYPLLIWAAN